MDYVLVLASTPVKVIGAVYGVSALLVLEECEVHEGEFEISAHLVGSIIVPSQWAGNEGEGEQ